MEKFEEAARRKLRFSSNKGELSAEELWDLSLNSLNNFAMAVNKQLKEESEESFIEKRSTVKTELELKLDILKYVIEVKLAEKETEKTRSERRQKAAYLKEVLTEKKNEELKGKSAEEIEALIAELGE